jgi:carbohydrate kinase (thermoresistant glucokinase family)
MGSWMDDVHASGQSAVLACSALRRRYREELLGGRDYAVMVFLTITRERCEIRLHDRHGHFFREALLASQFAVLEPPDPSEQRVYPMTASDGPAGELVTEIINLLGITPAASQSAT